MASSASCRRCGASGRAGGSAGIRGRVTASLNAAASAGWQACTHAVLPAPRSWCEMSRASRPWADRSSSRHQPSAGPAGARRCDARGRPESGSNPGGQDHAGDARLAMFERLEEVDAAVAVEAGVQQQFATLPCLWVFRRQAQVTQQQQGVGGGGPLRRVKRFGPGAGRVLQRQQPCAQPSVVTRARSGS